MTNPEQLFVMNAISRQGIAEMLRNVIDYASFQIMNDGQQELTNDDERLTDELCQQFAKDIGEQYDSEEEADEAEHNACVLALEEMGYRQLEEDHDEIQERHMLVKTIADLEFDLTQKRALLMQLDEQNAIEHVKHTEPGFLG